jgi:predicted anti-sigma-YlaC factor YlaD
MSTDACTRGREWLSAHRDGEAGPDASARDHLDHCTDCAAWIQTFDHLTRQARLRFPMAPTSVTAEVARIAATPPTPADHATLGRVLLGVAAAAGAVMLILGAAGIFGHSHLGSADGRQAEALTISLLGGFALAAWRPARLAAGLLPVAVLAAAITLALSIIKVTSAAAPLADELSHLPLLIGAVGASLAARATPGLEPSPRSVSLESVAHGM